MLADLDSKPYPTSTTSTRCAKFEQAADVVRSMPNGIDRVSKLSIKATGPRLAPLFDGSEQLISITSTLAVHAGNVMLR